MTEPVKFRGIAIECGDKVLIVPPLSTKQLEDFSEQLDLLTAPKDFSFKTWGKFVHDNMVPVALAALQRNYPEITEEEVLDFIDTDNYAAILNAFLGQSKADKVRVGEPFPAVMPGVASTPTPLPVSTGAESAPELQPTLDGPGITSLKM